jgi:penicillin-binding protein 1A
VGAAAEVYFGKTVDQLTLAEMALIAGLPRAPSLDNPVTSPQRARLRRAYVLRRMYEIGAIDLETMQAANAEPVISRIHGAQVRLRAPWVAEMARQAALDRFGPEVYTAGYSVVTTVDSRLQPLAQAAVRTGLERYDRRHGYRGPVTVVETVPAEDEELSALLDGYPEPAGLRVAIVLATGEQGAEVFVRGPGRATVPFETMRWARRFIDDDRRGAAPPSAADVVAPGHVIYVKRQDEGWALSQAPVIQGALIALDPRDGAIVALSGGFDFEISKFNRAIQARRQPGSAFKPFVYSAALERGLTAASIVIDAPVVYDDPGLEDTWRPQNYTGRFYGPMRLREALAQSRNLVSIRVLEQIGVPFTVEYLRSFGFPPEALPRNLTLALGSGGITPAELTAGYAAFANGGFRIQPYFIDRVHGPDNTLLYSSDAPWSCPECDVEAARAASVPAARLVTTDPAGVLAAENPEPGPVTLEQPPRAIDAGNAWIMASMLEDVIRRGTGTRARELGRSDLAGKTGTTNDGRDTWFAGFNGDLVVTAWVGFDQERSLGRGETGASTALPIWMDFMGPALKGHPARKPVEPAGLVTVRVSAETGRLARAGEPGAIFETFRAGEVPPPAEPGEAQFPDSRDRPDDEPLF